MTDEIFVIFAIAAGVLGAAGLLQLSVLTTPGSLGDRSRTRLAALLGGSRPVARQRRVVLGAPRPVPLAPGQMPGARMPATPVIRKGLPLVIPHREDPLWQAKGWRRNGRGYEGHYRAGRYQWCGLIQEPYPGSFTAYIWNPPLAELSRRTSHRPCFNTSGTDGRFKGHFHTMPSSLDHSIASIEAVLAEAMGVR